MSEAERLEALCEKAATDPNNLDFVTGIVRDAVGNFPSGALPTDSEIQCEALHSLLNTLQLREEAAEGLQGLMDDDDNLEEMGRAIAYIRHALEVLGPRPKPTANEALGLAATAFAVALEEQVYELAAGGRSAEA
ncbi:MAG: hypothetical protein OXH85_09230 [Truepera sp.]|nr:hypothetical protein [Truepera sp.]